MELKRPTFLEDLAAQLLGAILGDVRRILVGHHQVVGHLVAHHVAGGREVLGQPKQWAISIIGEKDYEDLVNLTKHLGGYVNESATMVTDYEGEGRNDHARNTCP